VSPGQDAKRKGRLSKAAVARARASQSVGECQTRGIENRQKLTVVEPALQMNTLEGEESAFVEAA
jgi:hypothetical protein